MKASGTKSGGVNAIAPPTVVEAIADEAVAERRDCIATAAYYKAQSRGFVPGKELEDWVQAEAEFDGAEQRH